MAVTATFEAGVNGNNVTTAGGEASATAWDAIDTTGGAITYDNAHAYGTLAGRYALTGQPAALLTEWGAAYGTQTDHYGRAYIYRTALLGSNHRLINFSGNAQLWIDSAGGIALMEAGTGFVASTSNALALNQWTRIEWHIVHDPTTGVLEVKLFNNPDSATETEILTRTGRNTGTNSTSVTIGCGSGMSANVTFWLDNIVAAATSYPGPAAVPSTEPQVWSMQAHISGHSVW